MKPEIEFLFWNFCFCAFGISQILLVYRLDELGLTTKTENIIAAIGNPLGQWLFLIWFPHSYQNFSWKLFKYILPMAILDGLGAICAMTSISLVGSGLYALLYSFLLVYNAFLQRFFFIKRLSRWRWFCLFWITAFIIVASVPEFRHFSPEGSTFIGIICALGSTVFYGLYYLLTSHFLQTQKNISPFQTAFMQGCVEVGMFLLYFVIYVVPRFDNLVLQPMRPLTTSKTRNIVLIAVFWQISCGLHQLGFYNSLKYNEISAITTAVNKDIQLGSLFILSSVFFCGHDSDQCLTTERIIGFCGISIGVLMYAFGTEEKNRNGI